MIPDDEILTVSVSVPPSRMHDVMSSLTAFLLHGQYTFLQTFYDDRRTCFKIDEPAHVSGLRLHIQTSAYDEKARFSTQPSNQAQPTVFQALLGHLKAVCARLGVELD